MTCIARFFLNGFIAVAVGFTLSCTSSRSALHDGGVGGQGGGSPSDTQGGAGGAGGGSGGSGSQSCTDVGATRSCDPEPCKRGTQTCKQDSVTVAVKVWGPCENVQMMPGCTPPDAACDCLHPTPACDNYCKDRPDGGGCQCPAGITRYCHTSGLKCLWGKQTCLPDGNWGPCDQVTKAPAGCETADGVYDHCCCAAQGQCCEDDSGHYHGDGSGYKDGAGPSVGKCAPAPCAPPPPGPGPMCPGKGFCMPGATRFAFTNTAPDGMTSPYPITEEKCFTQVCGDDGAWAAPVASACPKACAGVGPPGQPAMSARCCVASDVCCFWSETAPYACSYGNCPQSCITDERI